MANTRLYSIAETYSIWFEALRSAGALRKARREGGFDTCFMERIMLAVTEVNRCAMCSYAHTRMALASGMGAEEIRAMLAGSVEEVPDHELPAVLFAQHYAEARGKPDEAAWRSIAGRYGETGAFGILGAIRMMMLGNVLGIAWGSFLNRFRFRPDPRSSLAYELAILLFGLACGLVAIPHALLATLSGAPPLPFSTGVAGSPGDGS